MAGKTMDKCGESEAWFTLVCFRKGWEICKPMHHAQPYDFVIRRESIWETIQVKSVFYSNDRYGKKHKIVSIVRCNEKGSKPYKEGDYDWLVAVSDEKIWMIPWGYIKEIKSNFRIDREKYEQFVL